MAIFKLIPGCENYYAGSDGNIYSNFGKGNKKLSPGIQSTGKYFVLSVVLNGVRKTHRVHRLVCMAFHGLPPNSKSTVSHLDGNWRNNVPENLAWESYSENLARKKTHGTDDTGIKNSRAKISEETLTQIWYYLDNTDLTQKAIGEIFGLSRLFITKIKNGHRYKGQGK